MKVVGVVNLNASRARIHIRQIERYFEKNKFTLLKTDDKDELNDLYKKALVKKPDVLALGGGDGTIVYGINYALEAGYEGAFAVIPVGTANYLARNINTPLRISTALKKLKSKDRRNIFLASANDQVFALFAFIGVTVEAAKINSVAIKRILGQYSYYFATVQALRNHQSFDYKLKINGDTVKGRSHTVSVINAKLGKRVALAPDSRLQDPTVKLVIYTSRNRAILLTQAVLYVLTLGKWQIGIKHYDVEYAKITCKPKKEVTLDGEPIAMTPIEIKINKKPVNIVS